MVTIRIADCDVVVGDDGDDDDDGRCRRAVGLVCVLDSVVVVDGVVCGGNEISQESRTMMFLLSASDGTWWVMRPTFLFYMERNDGWHGLRAYGTISRVRTLCNGRSGANRCVLRTLPRFN